MNPIKQFIIGTTPETPSATEETKRIIKPSVTLFEWESFERIFKPKTKEFYRKIAVIIIFFAMMLLIIKEFLTIIVLGVLFFAVYVFTSVPPRKVIHKITTNGIEFASSQLYMWEDLTSFFIERRDDVDILIVNTKEAFPGRLLMLLDKDVDQAKLSELINQYVSIIEKPEKNVYETIMKKVSEKLNI